MEGEEAQTAPKLPLFSIPAPMASPEPSGALTPPIHAMAAVPFRWEEEPGKPRSSSTTALTKFTAKCLDLPPRLLLSYQPKIPKMPSPTTVLDGPYSYPPAAASSSSSSEEIISTGSFRLRKERRRGADKGRVIRTIVLGKGKERGLFGGWGWKCRRRRRSLFLRKKGSGGCCVFSSALVAGEGEGEGEREDGGGVSDTTAKVTKVGKKGSSLLCVSPLANKSRFWVRFSHLNNSSSFSLFFFWL